MDSPCVLVASCTEMSPFDIAKQILTVDVLPNPKQFLEGILAYPWHIDTKYYTADVNICVTEKRTIGDQKFAESVEAFILYFDSKEVPSFDQVKSWLSYIKEIEPSVQMLICECCDHNDAVSRQRVLKWCLENAFELVELNPVQDSGSEEDDFQETTGIKRIIQALHAHTWSNLEMKDRPAFRSPYFEQLMVEEKAEKDAAKLKDSQGQGDVNVENKTDSANNSFSHTHSIDSVKGQLSKNLSDASKLNSAQDVTGDPIHTDTSVNHSAEGGTFNDIKEKQGRKNEKSEAEIQEEKIDSLIKDDDLSLLAALGNEESEHETFEELFAKMRIMKETAESLPAEERKLYAEKVAISFWKAIGGDEDEIEGLDSDEEDGID